eukprot:scaffold104_cov375-Prasinococcus_capsulatus_cf.AAC.30
MKVSVQGKSPIQHLRSRSHWPYIRHDRDLVSKGGKRQVERASPLNPYPDPDDRTLTARCVKLYPNPNKEGVISP